MLKKDLHIVADDKIPFLKGVLEPFGIVEYFPGKEINRQVLKNADALITRTRTKVNKELLEGTLVKFVATATIGTDHLDKDWLTKKDINWVNAPGCNSGSVMQYIGGALTYLSYKHNFDFTKMTLGIIGVGNVGSKVARLGKNLGFNILLNDPPRERNEGKSQFTSLPELLRASDILSMHVPLNKTGRDKTQGLVNKEFLRSTKKGAIFINSSRGPIVEESSLKEALISRKIANSVLDVWQHEPEIDPELMKLVDIATPHIAGYSIDGKANGTSMVVNALSSYFHLPISNWYPDTLPEPNNKSITINCEHLSDQKILEKAVRFTYEIEGDDQNLRKNLIEFENLRGNYPIRREFSSYEIQLENETERIIKKLNDLGFKTK